MKNLKYYTAAALIILLGILFYSCDTGSFLNVPATGNVSKQTLSTPKGIQALLTGTYAALQEGNVSSGNSWGAPVSNWSWGSLAGGEAHKGSSSGDQAPFTPMVNMTIGPSDAFLDNTWVALYSGVQRANSVLGTVDQVNDISDAEKTEIKAEARFLRGHFYFYLTQMWGKVPWIDENTTDLRQPNDSLQWPHIEEDFMFAYNNLPETQSQVGKANKWAAAAYLGKTYLFEEKWKQAKDILDKVVSNGVNSNGVAYQLPDNFKNVFMATDENNSGTVFDVQFTANDGSPNITHSRNGDMLNYPYGGAFSCCGFYTPSQDLVNSFRTDANGLPLINDYNKGNTVKSDMNIPSNQDFTPYMGNLDPRLDWTIGRRGIPFQDFGPDPGADWVRKQALDGPYAGALKHIWWHANKDNYYNANFWAPGTAVNYHIIRFAGVLLMDAEANAETGNLDQARQLVNRVRSRVAKGTYGDGWVSYKLNIPFATAVVDNKSDVTGVDADAGDWVVCTGCKATFQLLKGSPGNINNWNEYKNANYKISTYPAGSKWFANKANAIKAIHFERKLELATEGHRFFDLVRWGLAQKKLNAYYKYEAHALGLDDVTGATFTKKHVVYPIPQRQIDLSVVDGKPTLTQNPGYQ
jgi:hypothetical protein